MSCHCTASQTIAAGMYLGRPRCPLLDDRQETNRFSNHASPQAMSATPHISFSLFRSSFRTSRTEWSNRMSASEHVFGLSPVMVFGNTTSAVVLQERLRLSNVPPYMRTSGSIISDVGIMTGESDSGVIPVA